jgi:hypothetical protein
MRAPAEVARMLAQSVVEYGGLAAAKSNLQSMAYSFRDWVVQLPPSTWLALGGLLLLALYFRRR